jgi:glutathione peroxidase
MRKATGFGLAGVAVLLLAGPAPAGEKGSKKVAPVLQFKMQSIDGKTVDLARYQGKVVLIVNVASECGYTPQYKGLQALHAKHAKEGLVILGVPSNDYGAQEPGTNAQIAQFCSKNYGVTFDMLAKVGVAEGKDQSPLYKYLTSKQSNPKHGGPVRWNFEKFLIGRDGSIVARFEADVDPESDEFKQAIRTELEKK